MTRLPFWIASSFLIAMTQSDDKKKSLSAEAFSL